MKRFILVLAAIGGLFLSGCGKPQVCTSCVKLVGDWEVNNIAIVDVIEVQNSGGHKEIQIVGQSCADHYQKMEYRIEWLDQNGQMIQTSLTNWTSFPAYGHGTEFNFKMVAPTQNACNYRILVRRAKS